MDEIGGTLKNAVYCDVKSGKAISNDAQEFAEYADKTIIRISCLYMSSDDVIVEQEEIKTAPKISEAFKYISSGASCRKEKVVCFTSIT